VKKEWGGRGDGDWLKQALKEMRAASRGVLSPLSAPMGEPQTTKGNVGGGHL